MDHNSVHQENAFHSIIGIGSYPYALNEVKKNTLFTDATEQRSVYQTIFKSFTFTFFPLFLKIRSE